MTQFYTVLDEISGEHFTLEGLQPALAEIYERWGGKQHKVGAVRSSLVVGGGSCIVAVEDGRVFLTADPAARATAQMREDDEQDGRVRTYTADISIGRHIRDAVFEDAGIARTVLGAGLESLMFNAALFVLDMLGDVPDCMSQEAFEKRERAIRAQLSRARTQGRAGTIINFPGTQTAATFELPSRPGERYVVSLNIHVAGEAQPALINPEVRK